jgi:HPt (histidine-containing phosphotransfer) domain-containing protein
MTGRAPHPDKAALALLDPDGGFPDRLRQDRTALKTLRRRLRSGEGETKALLAALETLAHRLAGAAGTFGYGAIGTAAMALEDCLAEAEDTAPDGVVDTVIGKADGLDMAIGTAID